MPEPVDEAVDKEESIPQRKDSLRQVTSKKQKKKAKKVAAAAKLVDEEYDENTSAASSPPVDLLVPPNVLNDHLLSSSPEGGFSDNEPPNTRPAYHDTPPIFAQEINDVEEGIPILDNQTATSTDPIPTRNNEASLPAVRSLSTRQDAPVRISPPQEATRAMDGFTSPPLVSRPESEGRRPSYPLPQRSPSQSPRLANARLDKRAIPNFARHPSMNAAPPPHMPQKHFSRAPDATFNLNGAAGEFSPGSDRYHCGFDTLEGASSKSTDVANNVLLIGSEGALDLCRFNRNRREVIGRLEGLRGSVTDAKILPSPGADDPLEQYRPLVACTVFGPAMLSNSTDTDGGVSLNGNVDAAMDNYETTVEIFSLKKSKSLGVLYRSALQSLEYPIGHPLFVEPKQDCHIVLAAAGSHIVVASSKSGEIFIFAPSAGHLESLEVSFGCVAKYWTRIRKEDLAVPQEGPTPSEQHFVETPVRSAPILALSRRWLVLSAPLLSSSQKSDDATIATDLRNGSPPGVSSYVSPPPPVADCEIDTPLGPGLLNRVTKQATNELRKGAQWVGEQGISMIKGYWNKTPSNSNIPSSATIRRSPGEEASPGFPPTHGHARDPSSSKVESALISIVDLQRLADFQAGCVKNALAPLATFSLSDGCSYLSFAPSGMMLMSTNQVGDVSTIWDLMRIADNYAAPHMKYTHAQIPGSTGLVRKISAFSRLSPSTVIDVRWASASNRVGILTSKGTLHLHEVPRNDSFMLPLRSPSSPSHPQRSDLPSPSTSPQDLSGGWMSNVRSGLQNVSGRLTAIRSASESGGSIVTSTRQSLNQASVAARYASGRVVRNGYNSALEGAYSLRHSQDNKIRLKAIQHIVRPGCFRWLSGRDEGIVSTIADGSLCSYAVKSNYHLQGKRTIVVLDASRKAGPVQTLPTIAATKLPPAILGMLNPDGPYASCARSGVHGFWTLNRDNLSPSPPSKPAANAANVQQDKETCPQYLPLHQLRQVRLYTYDEQDAQNIERSLGLGWGERPWLFGEPLVQCEEVTVQSGRTLRPSEGDQGAFEGVVGHMEDFNLDDALTGDPTDHRRSGFDRMTDDDLM